MGDHREHSCNSRYGCTHQVTTAMPNTSQANVDARTERVKVGNPPRKMAPSVSAQCGRSRSSERYGNQVMSQTVSGIHHQRTGGVQRAAAKLRSAISTGRESGVDG